MDQPLGQSVSRQKRSTRFILLAIATTLFLVVALAFIIRHDGGQRSGLAILPPPDSGQAVEGFVGEPPNLSGIGTIYVYGQGLVASKKDSTIKFYHQDALKTNSFSTDERGSLLSRFESYPYGGTITSESYALDEPTSTFTGKESDGRELYFGARYYDPRIGRFTSADPLLSSTASYDYGADNPLAFRDPTGRKIHYAPGGMIGDLEVPGSYQTDNSRNPIELYAVGLINIVNDAVVKPVMLPEMLMASGGINRQDRQIANVLIGVATYGATQSPGLGGWFASIFTRKQSAQTAEAGLGEEAIEEASPGFTQIGHFIGGRAGRGSITKEFLDENSIVLNDERNADFIVQGDQIFFFKRGNHLTNAADLLGTTVQAIKEDRTLASELIGGNIVTDLNGKIIYIDINSWNLRTYATHSTETVNNAAQLVKNALDESINANTRVAVNYH